MALAARESTTRLRTGEELNPSTPKRSVSRFRGVHIYRSE